MAQLSRVTNNIAIVGAGPSGIYCAINILKQFRELNFDDFFITIFDKSQALRTLLPTGGSRCNITNSISDIKEFAKFYPRGEKFLYSIFSRHFNYDTLDFFNSIGIKTYAQDDGRVFPISNSAKDVRDKMLNYLASFDNYKLVHKKISNKSELQGFNKIIISAGSRLTKDLIESFNHTCVDFKKALCALNIKNNIYPKGVSVSSLDGDFIFTDKGVSGPLAFKISSCNAREDFPYSVKVNLFKLEDLLLEIAKNPKKSIGNTVANFIPRSLAKVIVDEYDKNCCEISKKKLQSYCSIVFEIISASSDGEIVNSGGVLLSELDKNCKSKLEDNLWFSGEILDIDGLCGGFNLQNCWSSAWVVANDVVRSIIK